MDAPKSFNILEIGVTFYDPFLSIGDQFTLQGTRKHIPPNGFQLENHRLGSVLGGDMLVPRRVHSHFQESFHTNFMKFDSTWEFLPGQHPRRCSICGCYSEGA